MVDHAAEEDRAGKPPLTLALQSRSNQLAMRILATCMRAMPTHIRRVDAWWNDLYARIGGGAYSANPELDFRWLPGLQPPVRLRSGFLVELDLRDWLERRAYFSGRFYQQALEILLQRLLSPGDTWIDVGANIGLVSLIAAGRIGGSGHGHAFEPNPDVFRRLAGHVSRNAIRNFNCSNIALGADSGTALLSVPRHTGQGSLVQCDDAAVDKIEVPVARGDDVLSLPSEDPVVIKIDVEGYEMYALKGMTRILRHRDTAVIVEVIEGLLRKSGSTALGLLEFMASLDLLPFEFRLRESRFGKSLEVDALVSLPEEYAGDLLFLRKGSVFPRRLNIVPSSAGTVTTVNKKQ